MKKRLQRLERIKAIEREFRLATLAIARFGKALQADPSLLAEEQLGPADFRDLEANLEITYLVRIFAEFEAGLRDVWKNCRKKKTRPSTEALLDALAT